MTVSNAAGWLCSAALANFFANGRSESGAHLSMKTSMMPPQVPISCWSKSPVRSTSARRASPRSSSNTRALRKTSASPHPPPIVPNWPSSRTIILAPTSRGVEPRTFTTVARTNGLPPSRTRTASAQIWSGLVIYRWRFGFRNDAKVNEFGHYLASFGKLRLPMSFAKGCDPVSRNGFVFAFFNIEQWPSRSVAKRSGPPDDVSRWICFCTFR